MNLSRFILNTCRRERHLVGGTVTIGAGMLALALAHTSSSPASYLAAWLLALLGWAVARAGPAPAPAALLVAALALRVGALCVEPTLSDDIFRYVHEGRASRLGLAVPFTTPPAEVTPPPDDGITARVNHPEIPAAYPPTAQLFFFAVAHVGDAAGTPLGAFRVAFVGLDLLILLILWRRRRETRHLVGYALHPLVLLEAGIESHFDILGVALVAATILVPSTRRGSAALRGALLGLGILVKPIALLGALGLPLTRRHLGLAGLGAAAGIALAAAPYLGVGAPMFSTGLYEYATRWEANPVVYGAARAVLDDAFERRAARGVYAHLEFGAKPPALRVEEGGRERLRVGSGSSDPGGRRLLLDARLFARLLSGALLLVILGVIARGEDRLQRAAYGLAVVWLFLPTFHPWYLLWALPFAALADVRPVLWMAGAAPLLHAAAVTSRAEGAWAEPLYPRLVVTGLLIGGILLERRRRRGAVEQDPHEDHTGSETGR